MTEAEEEKQESREKLLMADDFILWQLRSDYLWCFLFFVSCWKWLSAIQYGFLIEGVCIRIAIFLDICCLISRMKDIQRTFMYHGAEHKCINCIEHGLGTDC